MARRRKETLSGQTQDSIRELIDSSDKAVEVALLRIYERQTEAEKEIEGTTEHNGIGFSGTDAAFGSSLAVQILRSTRRCGERLSARQMIFGRKIARKYSRQLLEIAEAKAAQRLASPENQLILV